MIPDWLILAVWFAAAASSVFGFVADVPAMVVVTFALMMGAALLEGGR